LSGCYKNPDIVKGKETARMIPVIKELPTLPTLPTIPTQEKIKVTIWVVFFLRLCYN